MKIFFVYSENYAHLLKRADVSVLINFATLNRGIIPSGFRELIVDSGGFQLQVGTQTRLDAPTKAIIINDGFGKTHEKLVKMPSVSAYALWLNLNLPQHPEIVNYFNLDFMDDAAKTRENQQYMESEGLHPIPIWHLGEDEKFLQYYYDRYEYIAVGAIAKDIRKPELRKLVSMLAQRYPERKYHFLGIGLTGSSIFQEWRPYSVDFSTWSMVVRQGHAIVEDKKQLVKEVMMSYDDRQRLRVNREFREKTLMEGIEIIHDLEWKIEVIHLDEKQLVFF